MVQYYWVSIATRLNQIFHPQVATGLEMNDGGQALHYSGLDRYYRHSRMQWQKNDGSVNFEQQFNVYDRTGNLLSSDSNGSLNGVNAGGASNWDQTYTYDGLDRLVTYKRGTYASGSIASPKFQQTWSLDALGNWRGYSQTNSDTTLLPAAAFPTFTQTRTANAVNEIGTITGGGYAGTAYDPAGNMTAGPKTGAVATQLHLVYDGWGRQSGYDANGDGDTLDAGDYRYAYDGLGRRITKLADTVTDATNNAATTEEYYYNGQNQVLEVRVGVVTGGGKTIYANPKERTLWDLSYVDQPAMLEFDKDTASGPDGTRDYRLWPTTDANHDVTGLVTDQGVTVERYAYTPYGERIILNGDQNYANSGADADGAEYTVDTNGSDFGMLLGFQGKRFEAETGGWNFLGRYQEPILSFLQRDPNLTAYQDGMSLTQFERGNSLKFTDPTGEAAIYYVNPDGIAALGDEHGILPPAHFGSVQPYDSSMGTIYHYTAQPYVENGSFSDGLRMGSFGTPNGAYSAEGAVKSLALPGEVDTRVTVTVPEGWPIASTAQEVQAFGKPGGGPAVFFPRGTPPGSVTDPVWIPERLPGVPDIGPLSGIEDASSLSQLGSLGLSLGDLAELGYSLLLPLQAIERLTLGVRGDAKANGTSYWEQLKAELDKDYQAIEDLLNAGPGCTGGLNSGKT